MKPQKRPQSAESAGAGGKKKAKQSDEPQQSGAAAAATGANWCSNCWALAQDACRGAHRLVDFATAQKDVAAEMSDAQREMDRARHEVDQVQLKIDNVQQRMNALAEGVLSSAPVLVARVPCVDSICWSISGGDVRITLASTVPLSADDIQAVSRALEGLELEYERRGGLPHARVDMTGLDAVMEKLPSYAKDQECERGDLLLDAKGHLMVAWKDASSREGAKLLGRVDKRGVDDLCACTCGGDSDCDYGKKYFSHEEIGQGTSFKNVRLAD